MQAPLRIAENKFKAASLVSSLLPDRSAILHSPFFTNGGIELKLSKHGPVIGYTTFPSMEMFWQCLRQGPDVLADHIDKLISSRSFDAETFYEIQRGFQFYKGLYTRAAMMFALSNLSETGEIFSGNMMPGKPKTHISDYALMNLKKFSAPNLTVAYIACNDPLKIVEKVPQDDYMICVPPNFSYNLLSGSKIVTASDINVNHEELHGVLGERKNWILIYKTHPKVLSMYKDYDMIYLDKYWRQTEIAENAEQVVIHNV